MTYWSSWSDFIAMGGYGLYVWGSFGALAAVVLVEIGSLSGRRRALRSARRQRSAQLLGKTAHEA